MKYLIFASIFIVAVFSQASLDPKDPKWGWADYKQLKCDAGYNKVSNYCVKCDTNSGKFFDSVTKQCRTCPTGTKYSETTKTCTCECLPPRQINSTTNQCECSGERVWFNNECKCPDNKPLWNGKKCVACPEGTTFEPKDKQCYHCPEGFKLDPVTHICSPALGHF